MSKVKLLYCCNCTGLFVLALYVVLATPETAYAYLDPGTGNAIIYVFISLLGALLYASKGAFYSLLKLAGKNDTKNKVAVGSMTGHDRLAIFSEGKSYLNTFKPIVDALIARNYPFSYYTMDVHDPLLEIDNENMRSLLIGNGSMAYSKMGRLHADIMLSTTPNIGTPGYPIKRSPNVKSLVHVFHSVVGIEFYHKHSLDNYDAALIGGNCMIPSIRKVEELRNLKAKTLVAAGLPYFDVLASKMRQPLPATDGKTILVAPSWGTKGCLSVYGVDFIRQLAEAGYNVILRPHPQSYKAEQKMLDDAHKELDHLPNFTWDSEIDGSLSMEKADLLISDTSNIRMDFALLYERPVITLDTPVTDFENWEFADLDEIWMETMADKIGIRLDKEHISEIVEKTAEVLNKAERRDFSELRDGCVANFRHSGDFIADYLISELNNMEAGQ